MLRKPSELNGQLVIPTAAPLRISKPRKESGDIKFKVFEHIQSMGMDLEPDVIKFIVKINCFDYEEEESIPYSSLKVGILNELVKFVPNSKSILDSIGERKKSQLYYPLSHAIDSLFILYKNKQESLWDSLAKTMTTAFSIFYKPTSTELVPANTKKKDGTQHFAFIVIFILNQYAFPVKKINDPMKNYINEMIDKDNADPLEKLLFSFVQHSCKGYHTNSLKRAEWQLTTDGFKQLHEHREILSQYENNNKEIKKIGLILNELSLVFHRETFFQESFAAVLDQFNNKYQEFKACISPTFIALNKFIVKDKQIRDSRQQMVQKDATHVAECYEVLGLSVDANFEAIKLQYKKLIFRCHPDKNTEEEKKQAGNQFAKIHEAFYTLKQHHLQSQASLELKVAQEKERIKAYTQFVFEMGEQIAELVEKSKNENETKFLVKIISAIETAWGAEEANDDLFRKIPEISFKEIMDSTLTTFKAKILNINNPKYNPVTAQMFLLQETIANLLARDNKIRLEETEFAKTWNDFSPTHWKRTI